MWRKFAALIALVAVVLIGVVAFRTFTYPQPAPRAENAAIDTAAYAVNRDAASARLSQAIQFRTVSLASADDDPAAFQAFHAWLAETYPHIHAAARIERVGLSLLFTWQGSDASLPPILLLAHQDVVPTPDDTLDDWSVDPFSGAIREGAVWGRGAIDDKASLIAILEAADLLARTGRAPKRTIIMAFGHDEELGGDGARAMAAMLTERGVRAWFALDEGMAAVTEHPITGGPAALIGLSEKGWGTLEVIARAEPGHSSMPPRETAVSTLARAVTHIHDMPIRRSLAGGPADSMLRALANDMDIATRMAVANEWLFGPVLRARLSNDPAAQALLGTTIAPTVLTGGSRANVLPGEARALINLRIHPRDDPAALLAQAQGAVSDLQNVEVRWNEGDVSGASPVSSAESDSYALIAAVSGAVLPQAPPAPSLVLAATDARHYAAVAENTYRYQPLLLAPADWEAIHGVNERLSVDNLERAILFYAGLMDVGAMQ